MAAVVIEDKDALKSQLGQLDATPFPNSMYWQADQDSYRKTRDGTYDNIP
jgi:hypothetical protein